MLRFVLRRIMWAIPTFFLVTFLCLRRDPRRHRSGAELPAVQPRATQAKIQQYREVNSLNGLRSRSSTSSWLVDFVTFDWGDRSRAADRCGPSCKDALANTLVLGVRGLGVGIGVGLSIGILVGAAPVHEVRLRPTTTGAFVGISIPPYVSAPAAAAVLRRVPRSGGSAATSRCCRRRASTQPGHKGFDLSSGSSTSSCPVTVVAIQIIAIYSRYMRASLLEVTNSDYLRTARAKGISRAAGDRAPRLPQRPDPDRHRRRHRHRRRSSAA